MCAHCTPPHASAAYSWLPDRSQSSSARLAVSIACLYLAEDELTMPQALVERPDEAGIALLQRKRLVAEKQLVVLHVTMEVVESTCLVEDEREPAPAVVLGVG